MKLCSLGTTNHLVGQPHVCWERHAAPGLWWDMAIKWNVMAAAGRQLCDVEQGWTVLSSTGVPWHSSLSLWCSALQPSHHLHWHLWPSSSLCSCVCELWALGRGGPNGASSLGTGGLCGGCSPAAERNPLCRLTVDKSTPGETEQGC